MMQYTVNRKDANLSNVAKMGGKKSIIREMHLSMQGYPCEEIKRR
jgi:hypothetical protein